MKPGAGGFTLIEVLVVLVMLGILASAVVPVLHGRSDVSLAMVAESWFRQADEAARRAQAEGRPWRWQIAADQASLLVSEQNGWAMHGELLRLPAGVRIEHLEIEGMPSESGGLIEFGDIPPIFSMRLRSDEESWRIAGQASGYLVLERGG